MFCVVNGFHNKTDGEFMQLLCTFPYMFEVHTSIKPKNITLTPQVFK